jgi:transposase
MARPKRLVMQALAERAEEELKEIANHKVCFRLQAIISSARYAVDIVAPVLGVHRSTIFKWIKLYNEQGTEGLIDKPKGHNPSKLSYDQKKEIIRWLTEGKNADGETVHWTLAWLIDEIERVFGIRVGKTPLWLFIRKSGFRQKVPRPVHAMADPLAQETFKKNL